MLNPNLNEQTTSHLPALKLLHTIGYTFLTYEETSQARDRRNDNVILDGILLPWLAEHNQIEFRGNTHEFSDGNLHEAVRALKDVLSSEGLVRTNEKVFDLLTLGKSLRQTIDGAAKSFSLHYIDWDHPENNVFHVVEEFSVACAGSHETLRPDLVLFVNGIPLAVIECKASNIKHPIREAISQHIRNQKTDGIPKLYYYSQLLLAVCGNEAKYGTTGTPEQFWGIWKEKTEGFQDEIAAIINQPLSKALLGKIHENDHASRGRIPYLEHLNDPRLVTEQDRAIYALCRPERLLELMYRFILFDKGDKKIARYQQYFCVNKIMARILNRDAQGRRTGGVVWHTQGSGKSLTMVFLAKSISLCKEILEYKIVLVTDRINLDNQLRKTFQQCGREPVQAKTGTHLAELIRSHQSRIITTVINKFEAAVGKQFAKNEDSNIFVLVDEGHRGQYGEFHAQMRKGLPNACYIGFTGTPVMKKDKNTVNTFDGMIDTYTIKQAVDDGAVVPLLYESRLVEQDVTAKALDDWFERTTRDLTQKQVADLKRKYATTDQLNKAQQKIQRVAWDISEHYVDNWQGTGFKAQLITQDKACALSYKKYLDDFGMVTSEVLISPPDDRKGETDIYKENKEAVQRFWKTILERFGSDKEYNELIINFFKNDDEPEIIIVVDKLITGFDAPRNTVLYLTRNLRDHTLLQAIARVNRVYKGKDFGFIIDYYGVLGNLSEAIDTYAELSEFDAKDLEGILTDISDSVADLAQSYSVLLDTFKTIKNKNDTEEYEQLLSDEELRNHFYERLTTYSKTLAIALSSVKFLEETPQKKINEYKQNLKYFTKLRFSVKRRYAEVVDFSEYEPKIQKLIDTHVGTGDVQILTPLVSIFDEKAFTEEVDKAVGSAAKADTIAHRTQRTIYERMDEDPVFYRRFSDMIRTVIADYREKRIKEIDYLNQVTAIMQKVKNRTGDRIPKILDTHEVAKAYYGIVRETFSREEDNGQGDELYADIALGIDRIINRNIIVNFQNNDDTLNTMRMEIEDYLFENEGLFGGKLSFEIIDGIMENCINIAKVRK